MMVLHVTFLIHSSLTLSPLLSELSLKATPPNRNSLPCAGHRSPLPELIARVRDLLPVAAPASATSSQQRCAPSPAQPSRDLPAIASSQQLRVGVVRSVNAKERTACVRGLKPVERAENPREFDKEEIVSVYELEGHPDYDYCYGDVVVRLSPVSVCPETDSVGESTEKSMQRNDECGSKMETKSQTGASKAENASGGQTCAEFSDLSRS